MKILGFNLVMKVQEKILAGTTSNSFSITPVVKESKTKEDKGHTSAVVTGYGCEFSVDGVVEVNETEQGTARLDRNDIIKMVKAGEAIPFAYGEHKSGNTLQKGKAICTKYDEKSDSDNEATYSMSFKVVTELGEEVVG